MNIFSMTTRSFKALKRCRGISLLEVIVAMAISSLLLASVWMMLQLLSNRMESGLRQSERLQVIRGLHQRLSRDLNNLVPDETQTPDVARNSSTKITRGVAPFEGQPVRLFPGDTALLDGVLKTGQDSPSLRGDRQRLELKVFADPNFEFPYHATSTGSDRDENSSVIDPTWLVVYRVAGRSSDEGSRSTDLAERANGEWNDIPLDERPAFQRALDVHPLRPSSNADNRFSGTERNRTPASNIHTRQDPETEAINPDDLDSARANLSRRPNHDMLVEMVTEIGALEFSYLDGDSWKSSWDSIEMHGLPRAIRARIQFNPNRERAPKDKSVEAEDAPNTTSTDQDFKRENLSDQESFDRQLSPTEMEWDAEWLITLGGHRSSEPSDSATLHRISPGGSHAR